MVYHKTPYSKPTASFNQPVVAPDVDPSGGDTRTITVNCAWLPFIRGSLQQLLLPSTWSQAGPPLTLTKKRVFNLIDLFSECSSATVPFFCDGDSRFAQSPFATWTNDPHYSLGTWVSMAGWQTTIATSGTSRYNGIEIKVTFSSPIKISNINILYDLSKGEVAAPSELAMYVMDYTSNAYLSPTLTFDDLDDGNGQEQIFAGGPNPTSSLQIRLFAASKASTTADPSPAGLGYIIGATLSGLGNDYNCS